MNLYCEKKVLQEESTGTLLEAPVSAASAATADATSVISGDPVTFACGLFLSSTTRAFLYEKHDQHGLPKSL